jgi:DNA-binding transcriptional LysR family regulator
MILKNLDLNKLKCFQAVAERNSLQAGAQSLGLTPSAAYQSIKKLEGDINRHLFFRSGKKYILTEEGKELQQLFGRFISELSQYQDDILPEAHLSGDIRVGLPLHFSKALFIPVLKKFNLMHPHVRFHLTIAETRRLLDQIIGFELDFAITDDAIPNDFLTKVGTKDIYREELVLVCSQEFYKLYEKSLNHLDKIKSLPHLDYSKDLPLLQRWYKLTYKKQVKLTHFHVINNVETMVMALKEGMGLGIIPKDFFQDKLRTKDLRIIPHQTGQLYNQLYLVQENNYINNLALKQFLSFLSTHL